MNTDKFTLAVADAFTDRPFSGNAAGIVLLDKAPFPKDEICIKLAAELKHSETAFIRIISDDEFALRFFTPVCEVALCGHATVASFTFLREKKLVTCGDKLVHTTAGDIRVTVMKDSVWLDMAEAKTNYTLTARESDELYSSFGLKPRKDTRGMVLKAVSVGLTDIMMPVCDLEELDSAVLDEKRITELSRYLNVTGVHMFCPTDDEYTAHCRNFAPLYGIPEECATGTSNGALLHYLSEYGVCSDAAFMQGEAMDRPSVIFAKKDGPVVRVGGNASILFTGTVILPEE